jgi:hypothetical protein
MEAEIEALSLRNMTSPVEGTKVKKTKDEQSRHQKINTSDASCQRIRKGCPHRHAMAGVDVLTTSPDEPMRLLE